MRSASPFAADENLFPKEACPASREDLSRLAGLGSPVPSSAVSDQQPIVGWRFPSACERQSPRRLDQLEAGPAQDAGVPLGQRALETGLQQAGVCFLVSSFYIREIMKKKEKSLSLHQFKK